ncbi:hypothetical protein [Nocardioides sp. HB32]
MSQEVLGVTVETWDAIGSIATAAGVLAAAAGSWFAYGQWKQGQAARLDQTRPYVVVTFEQGRTMFGLIDLVVRNVGAGPALNVTIKPDPPLERAQQTQNVVPAISGVRYFNEPIPLMPPGYELITFFDRMSERCDADPPLPERYTFTVSYDDGHGHSWTEENVVDLGLQHDLLFSEVYNAHHVADALRDIRTQLKNSPLLRGEVDATVETLADRGAREAQERQQRQQTLRQMREQRQARQQADNDKGTDTP